MCRFRDELSEREGVLESFESRLASSPGPNFSSKIFATTDARQNGRNAKNDPFRRASVVANIFREKFGPGDEAKSRYKRGREGEGQVVNVEVTYMN